MNQFGLITKKYCLENDIKQREIAEKIGLSQNGLSNALNRDNVSLQQMQRIASALNCKLVIELQELDDNSES